MSEPEPLDYHNRGPPPPDYDPRAARRQFVAGVAIGTLASAVLWVGGAMLRPGQVLGAVLFGLAYVVVPGTKLALGASFLHQPQRKSFGAGLLVSLPIGLLIFCGVCWSAMVRQ